MGDLNIHVDLPGVAVAYYTADGQPERLGLLLDLPGVTGEGQLTHSGSQWRGTLRLAMGPVAVAGLALLDERPPGLIVLLAAEFTPPIQLSFGFTLIGVGGVVGVNRAPNHERLREAMSSTDMSRLLFPRDPEAEANRLLPVLDGCFPRRAGAFVVGPTVKVAWGTPAVLSATVGVLVSDRDVTIIGRIAVGLPFEQLALVRLEANVVGRANANGLAIDATLVNSHIVGIPIDGDMRLRMLTGGGGLFALSAGGFHPAFPVPAGMTGMRRVGMRLSYGVILHARLEAYLAVTTNSAQFGARVELQVGYEGWGVQGHASFDTLFLFDPFRFEVDFTAVVSVRAAGIDLLGVSLAGRLCGPKPWRISGRATVKVLFARIRVPFPNVSWGGEEAHRELPGAPDPVGELERELRRLENWSTTVPAGIPLVRLSARPGAGPGVIHPWASVGFRQRRVPIRTPLTRMDGIPLGTPVTLGVSGDGSTKVTTFHDEAFIRQQFFDVDDRERLSGAGYTPYPGGFDIETPGPSSGASTLAVASGYQVGVREGGHLEILRPAPPPPPPPRGRPLGPSYRALQHELALGLRPRLRSAVSLQRR
jgi:hypothetical protein